MSSGLYIHIPFCSALCPYCDFAVVVGKPDLHRRYCEALVEEARQANGDATVDTVFIGGGTPTFVDAELLAATLNQLFGIIPIGPQPEISIEGNPESIQLPSMKVLIDAGINRLSIGAQSFDDAVLKGLGRTHVASDVAAAVDVGKAAGCATISLDLIYGGPGETDDSWDRSLQHAVALDVQHISCYALTIEERTPFGKAVETGRMRAPDDDVLANRYERAHDVLSEAGFEQYELSNWAKPGCECRHNLVYWTQGDYLGLGLGAHSHRDGTRWWNTRALPDYLDGKREAGRETLDAQQRAEEWLSLRMRLVEGISLDAIRKRFGGQPETGDLEAAGLVVRGSGTLKLTRRGMMLENEVTARLLAGLSRPAVRA